MSDKNDNKRIHRLSGFFLIVTILVIAVSILAVYSTILAAEFSILKDDLQISSLVHLTKSMDWLNDYNEEKIGERILRAQIDNMNLSLHSYNNITNSARLIQNLDDYKSHVNLLDADKQTAGSLLNLKNNAEIENNLFLQALKNISSISKIIGIYELVTILLIIGAGLGGMAEIARNKLLGYPAFVVGGIGVIILFIVTFIPSLIIETPTSIH
jgi:cell division protein FtsL